MTDAILAVRQAAPSDAEAVAAIYAHHVYHGTATFDTVPRTPAEMRGKIGDCLALGWPFLVATLGADVVGYAYATQFRDRPAYAHTCEDSIYIHPDRLGRGVGKALLAELIASAEVAGFRQMVAVIAEGEPASIALHARLGFVHAGRLHAVGRKSGRWLDTIYMQLALGAGDNEAPEREP